MEQRFLASLRCTYCTSDFRFNEFAPGFGILICYCDRFPVIDGIPVIRRGSVDDRRHIASGAWPRGSMKIALVGLLEWGRTQEALRRCLAFPITTPRLAKILGEELSNSAIVRHLRYRLCKRRLKRLLARRLSLTATDLFEFFCDPNSPLGGRSREATHSLVTLKSRGVPATPARPAIGCDPNFVLLWIARYWIEPRTEFVCCDVGDGVPLVESEALNRRAAEDRDSSARTAPASIAHR